MGDRKGRVVPVIDASKKGLASVAAAIVLACGACSAGGGSSGSSATSTSPDQTATAAGPDQFTTATAPSPSGHESSAPSTENGSPETALSAVTLLTFYNPPSIPSTVATPPGGPAGGGGQETRTECIVVHPAADAGSRIRITGLTIRPLSAYSLEGGGCGSVPSCDQYMFSGAANCGVNVVWTPGSGLTQGQLVATMESVCDTSSVQACMPRQYTWTLTLNSAAGAGPGPASVASGATPNSTESPSSTVPPSSTEPPSSTVPPSSAGPIPTPLETTVATS